MGHIVEAVDGNPAYDVRGLRDRTLVNLPDPAASDWEPLEAFLRPIWSDNTVNVEVRRWSTELFAIRDALRVAADLLPRSIPGVETAIAEDDLAAALLIRDSRVPPREFPEPTGYRPPLRAAEMARPEGLRILLPLIHEVIIDVGLDPQVWQFSGDLLDYPGVDSGSLRDRFLAECELPTTTVLAVVLDAETPANTNVHGLYSMLEKGRHARPELADSLLVVANRFDRLPAPPAPAATIAELATVSSDFRALLVEANELTRNRPDRIALTSALAGAAHVGYEAPEARPQDRDSVRQEQQRWQPTLDRLAVTDPGHPLRTALAGYLADGGIVHTRVLLSRHLATYGWRIQVTEALAIEAELDETMKTLRPATAQPAATARERQRIEGLAGELTRACTRYQDRLEALRLLSDIRAGNTTVDQRLLEEVARAVHQWHLWPSTERLATTRTAIPARRSAHSSTDLVPPPPTGRRPAAIPGAAGATTTAELLAAYHETRTDLADPTLRLLEDALRQWSATLLSEPDFQQAAAHLGGPAQPWTPDRTLLRERLALVNAPEWADYRLRLIDTMLSPDLLADRPRSILADKPRPGPARPTAWPRRYRPTGHCPGIRACWQTARAAVASPTSPTR